MAEPVDKPRADVLLEGQHEHTVDDKGRVSVPAEFRGALGLVEGDELVLTRHLKESCLLAFWPDAWEAFKAEWTRLGSQTEQILRRVVGGSARRAKVDRLGRIQVPKVLRNYAKLEEKRTVFVMGQGSRIELWSMDVWDATHGPDVHADVDLDGLM